VSYNGSGTFSINTAGQPVVTGTVISSTAFNALTADLATGLSTAITKDGQTTTTARILFAQGVSSTLVTDATSTTTGSIITAGGISCQKALFVGTTATITGAVTLAGITATSLALGGATLGTNALAVTGTTQLNSALNYGGVTLSNSVTGTGSMVLSASPTLTGTLTAAAATFSGTLGVTGAATFNARISQALTPAAAEYALRSTGQTTGWISVSLNNTGGEYVVAGENSSGNNLIIGDSAYDMVIRAPSGISFSANAGATQHMRLSSAGLLGIGMTPSNVLDITQTQDGLSTIGLKNASTGTSGRMALLLSNVSTSGGIILNGTGYTTSGLLRQDGAYVFGNGAGGLTLAAGAAQPIYFGINSAEVARFGSDGSLLIGSTTNVGAGNMSAKSHIVRTTVAAVNGTSQITAVRTASVSTSATTIYAMGDYGYLFLITGDNGGNGFTDLVISGFGSGVTVISSTTAFGSPVGRTYSNSSGNLQLAMASSTYSVAVIAVQSGRF